MPTGSATPSDRWGGSACLWIFLCVHVCVLALFLMFPNAIRSHFFFSFLFVLLPAVCHTRILVILRAPVRRLLCISFGGFRRRGRAAFEVRERTAV